MKSRWRLILKIGIFSLLLFVLYRLGAQLRKPEVVLHLENHFYVLLLAGFVLWTLKEVLSGHKVPGPPPSSDLVESKALLAVTFLMVVAYLLTAQANLYYNKPPAQATSWLYGGGHLAEAVKAGLAFSALIWILHLYLRKTLPGRDPWLFPLACFLTGTGLVFLFRLGPDIEAVRGAGRFQHLFWLQMRSFFMALLVMILSIRFFSLERIERLTRKRYVYVLLSFVLIVATLLIGTEVHGRKLSIDLGIMNFQTVELVKVLALFFMVGYFRYEMTFMGADKEIFGLPRVRFITPYVIMWFLTLLPIFFQKDLGPTALLFALFLTIFYLGTGSGLSVITGIVIMAGAGFLLYHLQYPSMVKTRIDMWLNPFNYSENMAEALWAVAAGGLFGSGQGMGMNHYIPVVHSDFNFAAIAEEWGALGVLSLLGVFAILVGRIILNSRRAAQFYQRLLVVGIGALWVLQTFIIVGGNLGFLPLTGITLPFISFGGSSLVINFLLLGLVMRFSAETAPG